MEKVANVWWSAPARDPRKVFMQEHIFDFNPPEKYRGHKCALIVELYCNSSDWKTGWNYEGFTLSFNNQANMKPKDFFPHTKSTLKK